MSAPTVGEPSKTLVVEARRGLLMRPRVWLVAGASALRLTPTAADFETRRGVPHPKS
jgi:hypothetical protein